MGPGSKGTAGFAASEPMGLQPAAEAKQQEAMVRAVERAKEAEERARERKIARDERDMQRAAEKAHSGRRRRGRL